VVHKIDKSLLYTQPSGIFDQEIETFLSQIDSDQALKFMRNTKTDHKFTLCLI